MQNGEGLMNDLSGEIGTHDKYGNTDVLCIFNSYVKGGRRGNGLPQLQSHRRLRGESCALTKELCWPTHQSEDAGLRSVLTAYACDTRPVTPTEVVEERRRLHLFHITNCFGQLPSFRVELEGVTVAMTRSIFHQLVRSPLGPKLSAGALGLLLTCNAYAASCTTQAEMKEPDRGAIALTAHSLAAKMQANDTNGVKAATISSVASNFNGIAASIQKLSPDLAGATLTVTSVYDLDASDVQPGEETVQFFCGVAANDLHVIFNIPGLPAGHFAFAIVEATGVKNPQRLSMLLEKSSPQNGGTWQLAGFFPRPLLSAGHDGVWYWAKAREYEKAGRPWTAYFYYQTAAYLLHPAEFLDSNNFDKLIQELRAATPGGLPGSQPMTVNVNGSPVAVTNIRTDSTFGGFDLAVRYETTDVSDPAAARTKTVALMKALLALHPEWKDAFHGMWVFANAPNQQPFSLELPMSQIASQT